MSKEILKRITALSVKPGDIVVLEIPGITPSRAAALNTILYRAYPDTKFIISAVKINVKLIRGVK
jgi:hypothetical protein